MSHISLAARAAYILRDNSTGLITKAAPALYPHQWSWDAAFNAIGLATVDPPRARLELDSAAAERRLGWRPRWDLDKALARVATWHEAHRRGDDMRAVGLAQINDFVDLQGTSRGGF